MAGIVGLASWGGQAPADAQERPKLPASAKRLNAAEIEALYRNATVVGINFDNPGLVTFSARINAATKTFVSHVFADNRPVGTFELTYALKGDLWCYREVKSGTERCVAVHRDGDVIYETNADGSVSARNIVQR
jgi:hypothetical protein